MISAPFFEVSRLQAITFKRAFRFLDGNCLRQNVIYQATVTTGTTPESYIGLSSHYLQRTVQKSLDIPHSLFYSRFPHPALNSTLLTQLWKRNTFHAQKFSKAVLKLLSLRSSCILFHKTWRSCLTAPQCKL